MRGAQEAYCSIQLDLKVPWELTEKYEEDFRRRSMTTGMKIRISSTLVCGLSRMHPGRTAWYRWAKEVDGGRGHIQRWTLSLGMIGPGLRIYPRDTEFTRDERQVR